MPDFPPSEGLPPAAAEFRTGLQGTDRCAVCCGPFQENGWLHTIVVDGRPLATDDEQPLPAPDFYGICGECMASPAMNTLMAAAAGHLARALQLDGDDWTRAVRAYRVAPKDSSNPAPGDNETEWEMMLAIFNS
jgi:hypothetical protein